MQVQVQVPVQVLIAVDGEANGLRFDGVIRTWNDERGLGFVEPSQGGDPVFVHTKAFPPRHGRPLPGQRVTFAVWLNNKGKMGAKNVDAFRAPRRAAPPRSNSPA